MYVPQSLFSSTLYMASILVCNLPVIIWIIPLNHWTHVLCASQQDTATSPGACCGTSWSRVLQDKTNTFENDLKQQRGERRDKEMRNKRGDRMTNGEEEEESPCATFAIQRIAQISTAREDGDALLYLITLVLLTFSMYIGGWRGKWRCFVFGLVNQRVNCTCPGLI